MKKFSTEMKEDSDKIYKYALINLALTFLPPGFLDAVDISGISFSAGGVDVLQKITALIVLVQTLSFVVSLSASRHSILADSSRILTDIENKRVDFKKNFHTDKNYYERTFVSMERVRSIVYFFQTTLPISICVSCVYFSFLYQAT